MLALALLLSCSSEPEPVAEPGPSTTAEGPPGPQGRNGPPGPPPGQHPEGHHPVDQGQQHPPIPADDPIWSWDAQGFVGQPQWYGEHSWADVRMRVAGHMTMASRDRARVQAARGDLAGAAATWQGLHEELVALDVPEEGVAGELVGVLVRAAASEAELVRALSEGAALPEREPGTLGAARVDYYALSRSQDAEAARALQASLEPLLEPRPELDLDAFEDFDARHQLRIRLYAAALDAGDPLGLDEPWGYWEASEIRRQALILGYCAGLLGGEDWSGRLEELEGTPPHLDGDPRRWPSIVADSLRSPSEGFTAEGLGWLPTGDSLIDVGAQPGPRAIGTLSKLGLEDPEHRAWLEAEARDLNALLDSDPDALPERIRQTTSALDAHEHGSRYYNVKQARNEAVRQLARRDRADLALQVLGDSYPLHHQDWACPNREGILQALEGRLLAESGQLDEADARLAKSLESSRAFLSLVDQADVAPPGTVGKSPPAMGPPKGAPPHR